MPQESSAPGKTVRLDLAGGIATVTIARPPLNILDRPAIDAMAEAIAQLAHPPYPELLVVTGAGERAFSAGVDVGDHAPDRAEAMLGRFHAMVSALRAVPFPTLAAVRGAALGGGCEVALACDAVIAEEGARFGQPEVEVGCFPPVAAALLPALAGPRLAYEMVVLGRVLTAAEALDARLINAIVPEGELESAVRAWHERLARLSPAVVRLAREALAVPAGTTFSDALGRAERIYVTRLLALEDAAEGIAAFVGKRRPLWKGC
jgi:cyclohexa-1,5-dienecarbonyl-CoA hydratase